MDGNNIIADNGKIGSNFKIGHFCIIEEGCEIGDDVSLGNYVLIKSGTKLGNGCKVGDYCKFGSNVIVGSGLYTSCYVEIRDNCVVGNNASFGSRCTISANFVIEDDVVVKYGFVATDTPDLTRNDEKVQATLGKGSRYGANVTIMPNVSIGKNAEIGACSQVRHDVGDNEVWFGSPAKFYRKAD